MKYGIDIATLGEYADPNVVVALAVAAEAAGWDGIFVWDHLAFVWGVPSGDPWVILAAVAQATERLKLGTAVTPIPRRRPQVLAHTVATLDILSHGRVIFGAGLGGVEAEFEAFGENAAAKERALKLDEGLAVMRQLWAGEVVTSDGRATHIQNVALAPLPVQTQLPIWIGGDSPPAQRRAAQYDGWIIGGEDEHGNITKTPEKLGEDIEFIHRHRSGFGDIDIAITGQSEADDPGLAPAYAEAGATWWLESCHGLRFSKTEMFVRVEAGPPHTGMVL